MFQAGEASSRRLLRRRRLISEKRQIMQLTMEPRTNMAEVAWANGVNSNHVFKWRQAFERGELIEACMAMLPVSESESDRVRELNRAASLADAKSQRKLNPHRI